MIIAFTGKAGAGKDTCAAYLAEKLISSRSFAFAHPLKNTLRHLFHLPKDKLWGSFEDKQELCGVMWENMPGSNRTGEMSYREVMEYYGTDMIRKMNPNFWLEEMDRDIKKCTSEYVLITDARFENEFKYVQSNGGILIKLLRGTYNSPHISNNPQVPDTIYDYIIDNQHLSLEQTYQELNNIIKLEKLICK